MTPRYFRKRTTAQEANATGDHHYFVGPLQGAFTIPYNGWNKGGADVVQAGTLADALVAFGLEAFTPPGAGVPQSITPRQLRLELLANGITQAMVLAALEGNPDPVQREASLIEWEHALEIRRDHPLVAPIAASIGMTTTGQIDSFFVSASKR